MKVVVGTIFINSKKTKSDSWMYLYPLGNKYVGREFKRDNDFYNSIIMLYDSNFDPEKIVSNTITKKTDQIKVMSTSFIFYPYKKKLYIADKSDFVIDVYDYDGNFEYLI